MYRSPESALSVDPAWCAGEHTLACDHHRWHRETDLTPDDAENAPVRRQKSRRSVSPRDWLNRERDPEMTVSQKMQVARDLVAQGWMSYALVSLGLNGRRRYCARGALNKAFLGRATSDAETQPDDQLQLAQRLVAEAMHGPSLVGADSKAVRDAITKWNDNQVGRVGQERVVDAFDAAIAECKRLEGAS